MSNFRKRPLSSISSCGLFDRLPKEIQFHLFNMLPLPDVGNFSLASEGCRLLVADWIPTKQCVSRSVPAITNDDIASSGNDHMAGVLNHLQGGSKFNPFAILVKRMTCLLNTRERITYAFNIFNQCMAGKLTPPHEEPDVEHEVTQKAKRMRLSSVSSEKAEENVSKDWKYTVHVIQFFTMLHTFVRGWDDSEFPLLLDEISDRFNMKKKINSLIECCKKGKDLPLATEMELRLLTRCLSWDVAGNDYGHRAAWLLAILEYFVGEDHKQQAMVFLLMFGPACQDAQDHYDQPESLSPSKIMLLAELNNHTDWERFAESIPEDFYEGKEMFYSLAQAVCSCISASSEWKDQHVNNVLHEMFSIPLKWKRENIAGFLLFCSEALILHYIERKLDSGKEDQIKEAGRILVDMVIISHKFDNSIESDRGIGKVFDIIGKYPKGVTQEKLIEAIADAAFLELRERKLELDEGEHYTVLKSLMKHLLKRTFIILDEGHKKSESKKLYDSDTDVENNVMEVEE